MRNTARIVALSMILLPTGVARNVQAVGPGAVPQATPFTRRQPATDHRYQTGLSVMPGVGYRVVVPYQENKQCGDSTGAAGKRICTDDVPLFTDLQLSFGAGPDLDLIADVRLGIARDPLTRTRAFAFAPGVRFWLDREVDLKLYTTVQGVYDSQDHKGTVPSNDFGLRNANGLMYDVIRNLGFFVQVGETIGLRRWFRIELDLGVGVQVRVP